MTTRDKYERVEIINKLIEKISTTGRRFLYSETKKQTAFFVYDGRTLYFIDHYTRVPMKMIKGRSTQTQKQEYNFSSGGTMWGLINQDFKDFIYGDDNSNGNGGYGGLYCPHWGYPPEVMKEIRDFAHEIGYLGVDM